MSDSGDNYLNQAVRELLITYGVKKLYNSILENIHEDFLFYSKILEINNIDLPVFLKKINTKEAVKEVPKECTIENRVVDVKEVPKECTIENTKEVSRDSTIDNGVDVVKEVLKNAPDISGQPVDVVKSSSEKKPVKKKEPAQTSVNDLSDASVTPSETPSSVDVSGVSIDDIGNKDIDENSSQNSNNLSSKQKQRIEQKQKHDENLKNGIVPESLLTKENLEQWITVEGLTCAHVAAKIVGCREEEVSTRIKILKIKRSKKSEIAQKTKIPKKNK